MFVKRKCVYLGTKVERRGDKEYATVHCEFENDEVMSFNLGQGVDMKGVQKYQPIEAVLEIREYKGSQFVRFAGVVNVGK